MRSHLTAILQGMAELRANPLRTGLSTLGVGIGVAGLVAVLALGDGLEKYSRAQLEETTDLHLIAVDARRVEMMDGIAVRLDDPVILTPSRGDSLAHDLAGRADLALQLSGSFSLTTDRDSTRRPVMVTGTTPTAASVFGLTVGSGRFLTSDDRWAEPIPAVATVPLAASVGVSPTDLVGMTVVAGGRSHLVVGVLTGPEEGISRLYVPLDDGSMAWLGDGGREIPGAVLKVHRAEEIAAVKESTIAWLGRYGPANRYFNVRSREGRAAQAAQGILVFKLVMGSITGIALLVGGIGIMNVLLASVAERTREIGVRRAVGGQRRHLFIQFIAESVAISGVGALVGVLVGLGGAFGITAAIRRYTEASIQAGFTWTTVLVSALIAMVVGLIFGTYPARRAAGLSPVDAMRND